MATRTIPSPRDRLATILVAPFATCSARLPVYAVLIAAFVPATPVLGWFTLQGLTLFGLYVLGGISAVLFAAIFKRGMLRGASLPFYLELPPYRLPSFGSVARAEPLHAPLGPRQALHPEPSRLLSPEAENP